LKEAKKIEPDSGFATQHHRTQQAAAGEAKSQPPPAPSSPLQTTNLVEKNIMRKLIISTLAAVSVFAAVSAANAGYWVAGPYGWVYVPTCGYNYYGAYVCG
jgi:hypothetical protein